MNKILAEISVGELLDKISILEIKKEKIKDLSKSKFIADEHAILKNQLNNNIKQDEHLEKLCRAHTRSSQATAGRRTPARMRIVREAGIRRH